MAFGLSSIKAYGVPSYEYSGNKFVQHLELEITGTTADVTLDIGDTSGTFWTDVSDAAAAKVIDQIYAKVEKHFSLSVPELLAKVPIASGDTVATGEYKVASPESTSFEITLFANEGLTSYNLAMSWSLQDGELPIEYAG
jgi:hypothetical protein